MSLLPDGSELEGDFEDLEGDADLNEWAAMGEDTSDIFLPQPPQQTSSQAVNKESQISLKDGAGKSEISKPSSSSESVMRPEHSQNKGHSNIFTAVGLPDAASSNEGNSQKVEPLKRKASSMEAKSAKLKKMESDILMAIETAAYKSTTSEDVEDQDNLEQESSFTQEELRNLDACLVSEMMGGIKKQMFLRMPKGDRFVVAFSPVELADLAHFSVQRLIESQPNLAFFFNRQGKFKKKKGYAQAYFTLTSDVRKFINMLMYVKLFEESIEVSISAIMNSGKHNVQVSFMLSSNNRSKLLGLLESEDPNRFVPLVFKASFQLEKVSTEATASVLMLLFPYASNISFDHEQGKDVGPGCKGPVNVFYVNQQWIDAVMACCSDFRYNGVPLKIRRKERQKSGETQKPSQQLRKDDKRLSIDSEQKPQGDMQGDKTSGPTEEENDCSRSRHGSSNSNISGSDKGDDDISNMTLDVCAGMMESLDKLKQMGTDNPNVLKILEMQSQLAALQKSLTKKTKNQQASTKSADDPWRTTLLDVSSDGEHISDKSKGKESQDRLTEQENTKTAENKLDSKTNKDLEILEAKLLESDKKEKEKEQRLKAEREKEKKLIKELETLRKRNSAKQWIAEAKQTKLPGEGTSEAAQRILQSFADKRREEQQSEEGMKPTQPRHASNVVNSNNSKVLGSHAPYVETRSQRFDFSSQSGNIAKTQDSQNLPFQDSFQPTTTFMESFSGRGAASKPLTSTPRSGGSDKTGGHQHKRRSDDHDDGLHSRLEEFQKELAQKGVVSPVKVPENHRSTISPDRPLYNGVPVYTEKEYHCRRKMEQLPPEYFIQTTFLPNRRCPVPGCPAAKIFKQEAAFLDHWEMFHKPTVIL
ncbi:hypothetical protein ElyMa_003400000 [Elysia marginata]|uniref:C2H2-type domain-containing protein n=1 Tax=Elysia marginata TaxID=1093978 RepID=A0AAV4JM47_9GAST|nr:hypothetical protein ElyMa_003400000 [Elysia marginata]